MSRRRSVETRTERGRETPDHERPVSLTGLPAANVDDVTRIRTHPLVPAGIPIYGYIDDVATGKLVEVPEATAAGTATAGY